VDERHIYGHSTVPSLSHEATDDGHVLSRGDEFLGHEPDVIGPVELGKKLISHGNALETAASRWHSFRQLVDDMGGLQTGHPLAVAGDDCLVEIADPLFVFFHESRDLPQ
jgi:hypothetical protein